MLSIRFCISLFASIIFAHALSLSNLVFSQDDLIEDLPAKTDLLNIETVTQNQELLGRIERLEAQIEETKNESRGFGSAWKNGLVFKSSDGDFSARFGGRIEQDWLWITGDNELEADVGDLEDGVFFRRARIQGNGTIYGIIDYFAEFEFAPVENIVFQDVWMQLNEFGRLGKLRAGHLKVPFGLDNETSARHLTFFERSAVHDAFQQEYDPGIMFGILSETMIFGMPSRTFVSTRANPELRLEMVSIHLPRDSRVPRCTVTMIVGCYIWAQR